MSSFSRIIILTFTALTCLIESASVHAINSLSDGWYLPSYGDMQIQTPEGCRRVVSYSPTARFIPTRTFSEWNNYYWAMGGVYGCHYYLTGHVWVNYEHTRRAYIDGIGEISTDNLMGYTYDPYNCGDSQSSSCGSEEIWSNPTYMAWGIGNGDYFDHWNRRKVVFDYVKAYIDNGVSNMTVTSDYIESQVWAGSYPYPYMFQIHFSVDVY